MDRRPIGIFDSGLGGLTAVKEIMQVLPHEDIVYFGDTGRVPYGTRGSDTITKYARQDTRFLLKFNIKLLIIACGTVTSVALKPVTQMCPVPVLGVLESAAISAANITKNGKIGIIGTNATIKSNSYQNLLHGISSKLQTFGKACPLFVPMVENGRFRKDDTVIRLLAQEYLQDIIDFGADTLILGCTHYPLLIDLISDLTPAALINPGALTAVAAAKLLKEKDLLSDGMGSSRFYVSDDTSSFKNLAELFLDKKIMEDVKRIDIENE